MSNVSGFAQARNFSIHKTEPSWKVPVAFKGKKPKKKDISEGFYLALYENQNHLEQKEDHFRFIREIVSDEGVQNASQISVTYDPSFQHLSFHKIIIWRDGKAQDRLNKNNFKFLQSEKELSRFIYSGTFDALVVLDDVRKGDKIEFSYTLKGFNPIFGKKYASLYYLEGPSSIGQIYTNIIFDKSRNIQYKTFNFNDPPESDVKGNLRIYEWQNELTNSHRTVGYEPSWYNPMQRVQLSEYSNWSEVVDWGIAVNNYPDVKMPVLDKKVKDLQVQAAGNKKKYIRLATRFVQEEIRYMGIEIGIYSHRPNSPEKVLAQRYGDCKDKSLLLVNLLKANGINAYMAYADTYTGKKNQDFMPSPFVFNHVIVRIDYDNKKQWIDPTISHQRGNFDDFYAPDYGNVLVLKKGVNAPEKINSKPKGKLISNQTFKLADTIKNGKTTLEIYSIYSDHYADIIRSYISAQGTEEVEKSFLEYFAKLYPDIDIKNEMLIEDNEEDNMIEITESYEISNVWNEDISTNVHSVNFYGDLISSELADIPNNKRTVPIALKGFVNVEQNVTVEFPFAISEGDDITKVESENYMFECYKTLSDSTIKLSFIYSNSQSYVEGEHIKKYLNDVKKINEQLSYTVYRHIQSSASSVVNFYMLLPYLLTLLATIIFVIKLYERRLPFDAEEISNAIPIGGWLIIIAIRMVITPITMLIRPFQSELFSSQLWENLSKLNFWAELISKSGFLIQGILTALLVVYGIFCAVLFFQKRKEFTTNFLVLTAIHFGYIVIDMLLAVYIGNLNNVFIIQPKDIVSLISGVVFSVAMIWYLLKSERAKQTFVFRYPKSACMIALTLYYQELGKKKKEEPIDLIEKEHENI